MRLIENIETHPDREFLEIVERHLRKLAGRVEVQEIFLVEIDNWFDQKWLGYSGKAFVQSPLSAAFHEVPGAEKHLQSVPAIFRKIPLTLPPFPPSRVLREIYIRREDNNELTSVNRPQPIHPRERQSSSANLRRSLQTISGSALFAWFSSNATRNGAASLMVYITKGNKFSAGFLAFRKNPRWKLVKFIRLGTAARKRRLKSREAGSKVHPGQRDKA
jgi:hypothetical protein